MSNYHEGEPGMEVMRDWSVVVQELDELQKKENGGRGVGCVRNALGYLRLGDTESARTVCVTDWDKIQNYPDLAKAIEEKLMGKKMDL